MEDICNYIVSVLRSMDLDVLYTGLPIGNEFDKIKDITLASLRIGNDELDEIIYTIEEYYGITIYEDDVYGITTLGEFIKVVDDLC